MIELIMNVINSRIKNLEMVFNSKSSRFRKIIYPANSSRKGNNSKNCPLIVTKNAFKIRAILKPLSFFLFKESIVSITINRKKVNVIDSV